MIQRFRRSFRKKKASVCINCQHSSKNCVHAQEYENIHFSNNKNQNNSQQKSIQDKEKADELLKWLDLDSKVPNQTLPNNVLLSRNRQRQQLDSLQQRPHSVYNDYSNMVFGQKNTNVTNADDMVTEYMVRNVLIFI